MGITNTRRAIPAAEWSGRYPKTPGKNLSMWPGAEKAYKDLDAPAGGARGAADEESSESSADEAPAGSHLDEFGWRRYHKWENPAPKQWDFNSWNKEGADKYNAAVVMAQKKNLHVELRSVMSVRARERQLQAAREAEALRAKRRVLVA